MFTNVSRPSAVDVLRPFAVGDTFYADTTTTLAKRTIGSTNDVLTVTGGVPVWSSSIVLASLSVIDSGFSIIGSADATKKLMFEVDAQTANDTLTINTGAQTDSRTLTIPVLSGNDTLAALATANAFTGTVSVIDGSFSIVGSADNTKTIKFEVDAQTAADDLTINSGAQTDDRTLSVPVLTGNDTVAVLNLAQTFTQAQTIGYNGAIFTVGTGVGSATNRINGAAATNRLLRFMTNGVVRWDYAANASAESGANAGSDFTLSAYADNGAYIDDPFLVQRVSGGFFVFNRPIYSNNTTDATAVGTAGVTLLSGIGVAKNIIDGQGIHAGVSSTATAAGTTTLTSASRRTQIFTGTTTQTLQLPAASLFGSGIGVEYIVINRSTGTVTAQRAGSDTFDGGGTTDAILTNTTRHYVSNGSNQWHTIA